MSMTIDHEMALEIRQLISARDAAIRELCEIRADLAAAREALKTQRQWWEQLPCGVDYDADPANTSPEDAVAHIAGLAVQEIDAVLAAEKEK